MGVGIYKSGKYNFVGAIDLENLFVVFLQPGIAQGVFRRADRDDFSAEAEYSGILNDAEFFQVRTAPWTRLARAGLQCQQLANIGEKQSLCGVGVELSFWFQAANSLAGQSPDK
jgi:hypothetical protein